MFTVSEMWKNKRKTMDFVLRSRRKKVERLGDVREIILDNKDYECITNDDAINYVVPKHIAKEIRADERRKLAEWLMKSKYNFVGKDGFTFDYYDSEDEEYNEKTVSVDELLTEYEKEQMKGADEGRTGMTTMELLDRGIGHNCLSDAYDLGKADGIMEANLDKARIGAEAIDEYVRRLCERCMQSENDCQKCPFADDGCQIVAILYEKYSADVAEALKPVTEKWKKDKRRTVKGGACMNCIAYSAHDRFRNYHGCQNCEYQPEPLQTCGYEDNIVHLICPKWKLRENVRRKEEENDEF